MGRKVFGFPLAVAPSTPNEFVKLGRTEAAAKLCKNRDVVRAGMLAAIDPNISAACKRCR